MMRMLIVGYCYSIRSERQLCEEVKFNLAYRWFCRLSIEDTVEDDRDDDDWSGGSHAVVESLNWLDRSIPEGGKAPMKVPQTDPPAAVAGAIP